MRKSRFSEAQFIGMIKEQEAAMSIQAIETADYYSGTE